MFRQRKQLNEKPELFRSKFGSIFKRARRPKAAPEDLEEVSIAVPKVKESVRIHSFPITSSVRRVPANDPSPLPIPLSSDRDLTNASIYSVYSSAICTSEEQSSAILLTEAKRLSSDPSTLSVESCNSGPQHLTANDVGRTAHSNMIEAFTEAFQRNRKSKLGALAVSSPMLEEKYSGQCAEPTEHAPLALIATSSVTLLPRKQKKTSANHTRDDFPRSTSSPCIVAIVDAHELKKYSNLPLPAWPAFARATDQTSNIRPGFTKACVPRSTLEAQRRQKLGQRIGIGSWSGSCPNLLELAGTPRDAPMSHGTCLFGSQIVLHWLCGGRKFFDPESEERLSAPGSMCLSIEHEVIHFRLQYPNATLKCYKSPLAFNNTLKKARYVKLPYADNTFDVICARALTTSILAGHWLDTLQEFKRILKPGGIVEWCLFDTKWLNASPEVEFQQSKFLDGLWREGFYPDPVASVSNILQQCQYSAVKVCHLAVPVNWGGRISRVWARYLEPLRAVREASVHSQWAPSETPEVRWAQIKDKVTAHRSSRGLVLFSATK